MDKIFDGENYEIIKYCRRPGERYTVPCIYISKHNKVVNSLETGKQVYGIAVKIPTEFFPNVHGEAKGQEKL